MLYILLGWPLLAFGGVYRWAAVPFAAGCLLLAIRYRPPLGQPPDARLLDFSLVTLVGLCCLQVVPLPSMLVDLVSPGTTTLLSALDLGFAAGVASGQDPAALATSIEPRATLWAVSILLGVVLLFLVCRRMLHGRGLRSLVRGIAWMGLVVSLVALAQKATAGRLVYWWWEPFSVGGDPFGPFINRNHFGTWAIMAAPLCLGHALARLQTIGAPGRMPIAGLRFVFEERAAFMVFCATVLSIAVVVSLSRSSLVGLIVALGMLLAMSAGQINRRRRAWLGIYALVTVLAIVAWTNTGELITRLDQTLTSPSGRLVIWRESLPIVRDFWLTGTGAGTYEKAMLFYQQSDRTWFFNQAHSQYVQVLVEGGLLLAVPATLAVAALIHLVARRLAADNSAMYWIRAGAVSGLAAVAMQSLWETGLRMPANAALAAVLVAIAIHPPRAATAEPMEPHGPASRS